MDAEHMVRAIVKLRVDRHVHRHVPFHVDTVAAIKHARPKRSARDPRKQTIREDDIDVRLQHEGSASAPHADILGDHLKHGKSLVVSESAVQLAANGDDPDLEPAAIGGPRKAVSEGRTVRWRIPFDKDELRLEPVAGRLGEYSVDKDLGASIKVAAVIVIAARGNDTQIRLHLPVHVLSPGYLLPMSRRW